MKIRRMTGVIAATAAVGLVCAPIVSADAADTAIQEPAVITQPLGSQAKLVDGDVIQGWTISDLKPSSDVIPYPVTGTLWEATATDEAIQGAVTPIVSNLNARADDGTTYRALFGAATPQGVNPATLPQGEKTTGKVYFDVTGPEPSSVVYNAGGRDLLVWTQSASSAQSQAPSSTGYASESPAPAAAPETPAEEGTPAAPASVGTEAPEGSQGTPIPAGSQGTPIPEQEAAPAAAPAEGTPAPASVAEQPESEGTASDDQPETPTTYLPTP